MTLRSAKSGKIRVAVLFGGRSGEHAVSCTSAASVLSQIDRDIFEVSAIGVTRDGQWRSIPAADVPTITGGALPEVTGGLEIAIRNDTVSSPFRSITPSYDEKPALPDADVVFPLFHGPYGEDGTIQGLLELADLPYVGPGVLASSAAMDKDFTKRILAFAGLSVAPWVVLRRGESEVSAADRQRLGLPVFVKPARAGSSLGVSKVSRWEDLPDAIAEARRYDVKVLVESGLAGREIECGVLEFPDGTVAASPSAEIRLAGDGFYDFDAKYLQDAAEFDIPSTVSAATEDVIRTAAVDAFRALDASGLARVDFFVGDDGSVTVNEVNTMPGFTPISMYPRMWQAAGIEYSQLITTLIETALARGSGLR